MKNFDFMFIIVPIFMAIIFIITIGMFIVMLVPSLRAKLFGAQLKSRKMIIDENKDILKEIYDTNADIESSSITKKSSAMAKGLAEELIKVRKEILEENEESLKDISRRQAEIDKEQIKVKAETIKQVFNDTMYCRHCGASIASDSEYCNICGKKI